MRDVFAARKVSKALELSLQLARLVLSIAEEDDVNDDAFRSTLLDDPEQILSRVRSIDAPRISALAYEQLCCVLEDTEYNPAAAARESEAGFFLDLHHCIVALRRELEAEHARSQRLLPTASFVVGVDGSRQSYMAFEVASRLCRQGQLAVLHVNEEQSSSLQLPLLSTDFLLDEYKAHCARLKLPTNRVTITCESSNESVACHLLRRSASTDFLVVGAVGKAGPAVEQLAHVPRELLQHTHDDKRDLCVLIVPSAPVNSIVYRQNVIVVAVDRCAARAAQCLNAALKLARPVDAVRVVHFYSKPVVGDYDELPFASHRAVLETCKLSGAVDVLPLAVGVTIAESIQDYVMATNASFLVIGRSGERLFDNERSDNDEHEAAAVTSTSEHETDANRTITSSISSSAGQAMGRVATALLFSPRCAMCVCI